MTATASQARQTFIAAERKLQAAVAEYGQARKALHAITGEFVGTDENALQRFSTTLQSATRADGKAPLQTDC